MAKTLIATRYRGVWRTPRGLECFMSDMKPPKGSRLLGYYTDKDYIDVPGTTGQVPHPAQRTVPASASTQAPAPAPAKDVPRWQVCQGCKAVMCRCGVPAAPDTLQAAVVHRQQQSEAREFASATAGQPELPKVIW